MSRRVFALLLAVLAPTAVFLLVAGRARGEEPPAHADPKAAVASLMKALRANSGTVRIGMTVASADRAVPASARHVDQRYVPLHGSWLDKERRLHGTVDWDPDLETGKKVDTIRAVLLPGPFDRKEMAKAVVAAGKQIGLAMEPDDEAPDTWFDANAKGVEVWVTLGTDIVVVESMVLD